MEQIDEQRVRAMALKEDRPHSLDFSPMMQEAFCDINVYRYIYDKVRNKRNVNISTIIRIKKQWQVTKIYTITGTEADTKEHLKQSYEAFQ